MDEILESDTRVPHIVLAGDVCDVPAIRVILAALPDDAYGQVFLEVTSPAQVVPVTAPPRVTVTWLHRDRVFSEIRNSLGAMPGEALTRAVSAWVAEWMPDDPGARRCYDMRVGYFATTRIKTLYRRFGIRLPLPGAGM